MSKANKYLNSNFAFAIYLSAANWYKICLL